MDKKYNHLEVEKHKNQKWIDKKYFSTHDKTKQPFTIILPPPNVTGMLHLGHAWDSYIQDTIIRYKKLQGFDVMWIPAMDHAGIATQAKVEEKLRKENIFRLDLGREKFLDKIWDWKNEFATKIRQQWGSLGLGLDYSNERFTLDQGLSEAVSKVFIDLYNRDLIYKGKRPINWDPKLQTVLSNVEVRHEDIEQTMFYIAYDLKSKDQIIIATVRPETLFSDVALAINPHDLKNKHFLGQEAIHPLTGHLIPVIADESIEINKGTGVMKVSAHAEMDYEIIIKNDLKVIECIDKNGKMNENAQEFQNLDRFVARHKIVEKLKANGKIIKEEKVISKLGYSSRSNEIIEILIQPQWFVKMKTLAQNILRDLKMDGVKFYPPRFEKTLKHWMQNVRDWCISRQLWWGHRIPSWTKNKKIQVQVDSPGKGWKQEEDVLDTWFSSGLAPFSFLGWPREVEKLERYYPTNVLVTGYDIIFFWVARMYFQSLDIMKKKPFQDVLIHGLIRAENGQKMSKSLGNGINPMEEISKYGSDALRWFLLTNSCLGQDIRYDPQKMASAWSLNNKLWNIARYIIDIMEDSQTAITSADEWINNKLYNLQLLIAKKMSEYDFTIIGKEITKFIIEDLSGWYIELSKNNPNKKFAINILKKTLIIFHPFFPFITDHIYSLMGEELLETKEVQLKKMHLKDDISRAMQIIKKLRTFRNEKVIANKIPIYFWINTNLSDFEINAINNIVNAFLEKNNDALIPLNQLKIYVKISKEQKQKDESRFLKSKTHLESEIQRAKKILSNNHFLEKAPLIKINLEKSKLQKFENELKSLKDSYS